MNFISTDGGRSWFTAPEEVEPSPRQQNGDAAPEKKPEQEEDAPVGLDRLRTPEDEEVAPLIDLWGTPEPRPEAAADVEQSEAAPIESPVAAEVEPEVAAEVEPEVAAEVEPEVAAEVAPEAEPEIAPEAEPLMAPPIEAQIAPSIDAYVAPMIDPAAAPEVEQHVPTPIPTHIEPLALPHLVPPPPQVIEHHWAPPPPPPPHHSEAPPPPPPPSHVAPRRRRRPVVLAVVTAAAILVLGGAGTAVALVLTRHDAAPTVTAHVHTPGLTPESGAAVFEDDFTDPFSGWPTGPIDPSATATYGIPGFVIDGRGTGPHFAHSPYPRLVQTIGATVKVKVIKGDNTSGVGIRCDQPLVSTFSYSFYVFPDGRFSIVSDTGTPHLPGYEITSGSVPGVNGVNESNTISAACMNVKTPEGVTVARLMLQVNGSLVSDYTDTLYLNGLGWGASVLSVTAAQQASQVAFRDFIVRDLTGAKPGECARPGIC